MASLFFYLKWIPILLYLFPALEMMKAYMCIFNIAIFPLYIMIKSVNNNMSNKTK